MAQDYWMDLEQCANEIRVSEETIRRFVASGRLVAHKFGRLWPVRRSDWERFVQGAQVQSNQS